MNHAINGGRSVLTVLQGLVPVARRLVGAVRVLAVASAVAVGIIVLTVLGHGWPSLTVVVLLVVVVAVLAPAPILLVLFHGALVEALELPAWLRRSPDLAKGHASELADLVVEAHQTGSQAGGSSPRGFVRDTGRAGRLLLETHRDLPGYGSMLRLMSIPFLVAVSLAVFAAFFEIGLAAGVVMVDLVVRLLG